MNTASSTRSTKRGCDHNASVRAQITSFETVFWDFDGVIKESVDVKAQAFVKLFEQYGEQVVDRVRLHHEANGGMSRFDKLPLYLRWAGEDPTEGRVNQMCDRFSELAFQQVIDAPFVPGAEDYLRKNFRRQTFVLVSATPQREIERILHALDLGQCFANVFGAPTAKATAIGLTLRSRGLSGHDCLMIGDARADFTAAEVNHLNFLLRRHSSNRLVFADYTGLSVDDFSGL